MDVQAQAGLTPPATRAVLVATLATTGAALGLFLDHAGELLVLFTALFLLRVAGQLMVLSRGPAWLPPMGAWNFVPYRVLLPVQLALLVAMSTASAAVVAGWQPPSHVSVLVPVSFAYWGAMAARYTLRIARQPAERWFGGTVPIVFHVVLAAFLFVLGSTAS